MIRISGLRWAASIAVSSFLFTTSVCAQVEDAAVKIKWGYKGNIGPAQWARLSPEFTLCAKGTRQSPINISKKAAPAADGLLIRYRPAEMVIMDDGPTELTIGGDEIITNTGHGIQLNFPTVSPRETITYNHNDYRLVQFHLHTPAENQLDGQTYPMEIHFVHQGADGALAVLGVFVKAGQENGVIKKIIDNLPKMHGEQQLVQGESINPMRLLPQGKDYYSFPGSLTTPPCTEGVQWLVMADAITASPAQIAVLRKAVEGTNARPVQSLNGRKVTYSKISE